MIDHNKLIEAYDYDYVYTITPNLYRDLILGFDGKAFNKNSIEEGSNGNKLAKVMEYCYFGLMSAEAGVNCRPKSHDKEVWDFMLNNNVLVDTKARRRNTSTKLQEYSYDVDHSQLDHAVDIYVFGDVFFNSKQDEIPVYCAFAGWIYKSEFLEQAQWFDVGDLDDGFVQKAASMKIKGNLLYSMPEHITNSGGKLYG